MIELEINNRQDTHPVDEALLHRAAATVLAGEGIHSATISLAVVDDATMHALNRRYLNHDYPTDVLSFLLDHDEGHLEGEVVVSADTAARTCGHYAISFRDELALYVVHGTLHLTGLDDQDAAQRQRMRERERHYLGQLGLAVSDVAREAGDTTGGAAGPCEPRVASEREDARTPRATNTGGEPGGDA